MPTACDRIRDKAGKVVEGDAVLTAFNKFYVSIGQELSIKFPATRNVVSHPVDIKKQCSFRFVGTKEVNSVIRGLKNSKSTCVDDISMRVLKDVFGILLIEVTQLVNVCLDKSLMPQCWKIGTVSPIPKGSPSLSMGDYRPISVLPAPSKIIERLVYNQLVYYLECNRLLDRRQHGFRKNHSTATAIIEVVQYLYERMDYGDTTHCVFIDYSKVFDTLNHEILCTKLGKLGFDWQIVCWCRNYLTDRHQSVKIGGKKSPCLPITCGVPQGSILGPLFFIIYVNDLLELFSNGRVRITLYADDTVLYISHQNSVRATILLQEGLEILSAWCIRNKLTINTKKTKHMIVTTQNHVDVMDRVSLNGETLDLVRNYNYLGVKIDDKLTFDAFLKEKGNKVNVRIYQLQKLRKYITKKVACLIYKQTILPVVEYADQIVESGPADKIDKLQSLQDKAVKIINNKEQTQLDAAVLATVYRIKPLKERRAEHLSLVMYRLSKENLYVEKARPEIHLRNRNKIKFKAHKRVHERYLKSPLSRGISMWDRLPESVQRSTTKVKFKRDIKPHLANMLRPILR